MNINVYLLLGACWIGGWGRVIFNGKIKKALIVDMTFASHLRICLDAHLVHIGKGIQAGVPHDSNAWNTWHCSATSLICDLFFSRL